jgi:hypothetical protein
VDLDLAALSSAAATTLVALMTTDSWEQAKAAFARLWRHCRAEQVVDAELKAARLELIDGRRAGDEQIEVQLVREWQSRLRRLALADELIQDELQQLVKALRPMLPDASQSRSVVMEATASGFSTINQAGRDQNIFRE